MKEVWYLLFKGESCDGMGKADFYQRTTSKSVAKDFFLKEKKNPYSTSCVMYVTDNSYHKIFFKDDFIKT